MALTYLFCPIDGCAYRTGANGPRDVQARNALMAHLQRKMHGLDRAAAHDMSCWALFGQPPSTNAVDPSAQPRESGLRASDPSPSPSSSSSVGPPARLKELLAEWRKQAVEAQEVADERYTDQRYERAVLHGAWSQALAQCAAELEAVLSSSPAETHNPETKTTTTTKI